MLIDANEPLLYFAFEELSSPVNWINNIVLSLNT